MVMPGLLRFGFKAGVMFGAVYLTVDKGVWKDNETTGELYLELRDQIKPLVQPIVNQIPFEIPKLPQTGDLASTAKTTWNKGIMASCLFLVELPGISWEYMKKGTKFAYDKYTEFQSNNSLEKGK